MILKPAILKRKSKKCKTNPNLENSFESEDNFESKNNDFESEINSIEESENDFEFISIQRYL